MAVRFSVETCRSQLAAYMEAEKKVLNGQSYSIGGRTLTRANLADIRKGIEDWAAYLAEAERIAAGVRSGIRMVSAIPHG